MVIETVPPSEEGLCKKNTGAASTGGDYGKWPRTDSTAAARQQQDRFSDGECNTKERLFSVNCFTFRLAA